MKILLIISTILLVDLCESIYLMAKSGTYAESRNRRKNPQRNGDYGP